MMQDFLASIVLALTLSAGSVLIAGCLCEPTFADRCQHCGEYLEDADAAHEHVRGCQPCR
jgi:hypothetical protein